MKKKVAIISPEFPPFTNWGGVATFNKELSLLLQEIGFTVHIISLNSEQRTIKKKLSPNVYHHAITLKSDNKYFNFIYYKVAKPLLNLFLYFIPEIKFLIEWNLFSAIYFNKINKNEKIFSIHSPSYFCPSMLIKLLNKNIKLISHIQGPQKYLTKYVKNNTDLKLKAIIEDWFVANLSDIIIPCNEELIKECKAISKKGEISYIQNFISEIHLNNSYTSFDSNNIVFWGRIEHRKGIESLIKAHLLLRKKNKKLQLWLIGKDMNRLKLKNRFVNLNYFINNLKSTLEDKESIHHINNIDSKSTLQALVKRLSGICVFPSLQESFGFVYIESMSLGMITIGSNQTEAKNIISPGLNGFLCYPSSTDIKKTIEIVQKMSSQEIRAIRKASQKTVIKNYSRKSIKGKYINIYKKIF